MKHGIVEGDAASKFSTPPNVQTPFSQSLGDLHGTNWVARAAKKLDDLSQLAHGWDSYGGLPLSAAARRAADESLDWLKSRPLPMPEVVLGSGGNVSFEWRVSGRELELDFGEARRVEFVKVDESGSIEEGQLDADVQKQLGALIDWLMRD